MKIISMETLSIYIQIRQWKTQRARFNGWLLVLGVDFPGTKNQKHSPDMGSRLDLDAPTSFMASQQYIPLSAASSVKRLPVPLCELSAPVVSMNLCEVSAPVVLCQVQFCTGGLASLVQVRVMEPSTELTDRETFLGGSMDNSNVRWTIFWVCYATLLSVFYLLQTRFYTIIKV